MRLIAPLIIALMVTGCSSVPKPNVKIGDQEYTVTQPKFAGIKFPLKYKPIVSRSKATLDKVYSIAAWLIVGGLLLAGVCVGLNVSTAAPFLAGWFKVGAAIGGSVAILGLLFVGVPWYVWALVAVVTLGASHYMHRFKDTGVDKATSNAVSKLKTYLARGDRNA